MIFESHSFVRFLNLILCSSFLDAQNFIVILTHPKNKKNENNENYNIHKSEAQEMRWKYKVAVNITEYHFVSKLILLRIIHDGKLLFHVKNVYKIVKKSTCLKWTCGLIGHNNRIATLSIFYLTVLGIIIINEKSCPLQTFATPKMYRRCK